MKMTIILTAVAGLCLAGCAKKASPTNPEPGGTKIELASADAGARGCHGGAKVEMASATEGTKKHCAAVKADGAHCKMKQAELAKADCTDCPKLADGKCDHEAGVKLGKDCCKKALSELAVSR